MTTNINFYGKPFGAPLLPNKMTSDGWSIADARHIGGHRVVDVVADLYELYDWQLVNPSALLKKDTASAVGQKWYVKGDGTYMLKDYSKHNVAAGWVKILDANGNALDPSDNKTIISKIQSAGGDITGIANRLTLVENKVGKNANSANNAIILDTTGYLTASVGNHTLKKINGVNIYKSGSDTADITIDLSLYIVPTDNKLPTSEINPNKIYLIKDGTVTGNVYTEYMYVNNAWEKLGNYESTVELKPYLKISDAETTYLKISDWNTNKANFVSKNDNSPASYILYSGNTVKDDDANDKTSAASVAYAYATAKSVKDNLTTLINGKAATTHTHTVTINGTTKTIGSTTVDLGTYATSATVDAAIKNYGYSSKDIDSKFNSITYSSVVTSTDTKAPTGAAVYSFVSDYTVSSTTWKTSMDNLSSKITEVDGKVDSIVIPNVTTLSNNEVDNIWTSVFG